LKKSLLFLKKKKQKDFYFFVPNVGCQNIELGAQPPAIIGFARGGA
jgi:hypothetical protein